MAKRKRKEKSEQLLTIKEMAALLKVSEKTIVEWVQYRRIPYVRVDGEYIRFRLSDIAEWIKGLQKKKRSAQHLIR